MNRSKSNKIFGKLTENEHFVFLLQKNHLQLEGDFFVYVDKIPLFLF